jgi:CHASE3 domain sensor protein
MNPQNEKRFLAFAQGSSLRHRVAYSLAIVRLVLVPVFLLAVFYLFRMGWIVDRIVSTDAPAASLAQQVSIEMLEARRAERNYLLLRDSVYLQSNLQAVEKVRQTLHALQQLEPGDRPETGRALDALRAYEGRVAEAITVLKEPGQVPADRIRAVVHAYEKDLNELLASDRRKSRAALIDELRSRVGSFDAQIAKTVQEGDPAVRQLTQDLQISSQQILQIAGALEARNWGRVEQDHQQARALLRQAEWALGIASALTFLASVWISFLLPREVVKPLVVLREAVDRAAAGDVEVQFDVAGEGELAQLARSVRNLVTHAHAKS